MSSENKFRKYDCVKTGKMAEIPELTDPEEIMHIFEMCLRTNICRKGTQHILKVGPTYSSFGYPKNGASDNH